MPVGLTFYVVRTSLAVVNVAAVQQFVGMRTFFGGRASNALVEQFAPGAEAAITVAGDQDPALMTELVFCMNCYVGGELNLPEAEAALATKREREKARG